MTIVYFSNATAVERSFQGHRAHDAFDPFPDKACVMMLANADAETHAGQNLHL